MPDNSDTDDSPAPAARARSALTEVVERLEAANELDNPAEIGLEEQESVSHLVEVVGQALVDGMNEPVGMFAGAVADASTYFNKSDVKGQIADKAEELRGGSKQPLNEFVQDRLKHVTVVSTTDHKQGATYVWDFGEFRVETRSGADGRGHFHWSHFRDLLLESGGVNVGPPESDYKGGEEWRDFMVGIVAENKVERHTRGPRTEAFEALQNKIQNSTGYGTAEGALDHGGLWLLRESEDVPDWWAGIGGDPTERRDLHAGTVQEIRVHESDIKQVVEDVDINRSDFYHELDARGMTLPHMNGASMTQWVDGSNERFWALLPDIGTPRTYVPDKYADPPSVPPLNGVGTEKVSESPAAERPDEPVADALADGSGEPDGSGFQSVGDADE